MRANGALGSASTAPEFQTTAGQPLKVPAEIPLDRATQWDYSPNGTRLAFLFQSIWVWSIDGNEVNELPPAPENELYAYVLHRGSDVPAFYWTDDTHILACESHNLKAESAAWLADHTNPLPTCSYRWVLFDVTTGERVRVVSDVVNGGPDGLQVVGVQDADVWYVKALDGKLRTYDSCTQEVGPEAYFDYNSGCGYAIQVSAGSMWFSALVPHDAQDPLHGRLDVFNITTGETRSAENIFRAGILTTDGRYLFSCATAADGLAEPRIDDIAFGVSLGVPAGERWLPGCISTARGVLLVGVPENADDPRNCTWKYAEVPLDYLLQM